MCCIFTCCGWMIDLIQRFITFSMSCCISTAVCCALVTSIMSGIALGYNYSLAEYIDLKETNVSVYLKRGIFDDEIADDFSWRRAGHLPVAGHLNEDNLVTGAPANEDGGSGRDFRRSGSGNKLDQSIYESDENKRFEGALLKLTTKTTPAHFSMTEENSDMDTRRLGVNVGVVDMIKDIQSSAKLGQVPLNPAATAPDLTNVLSDTARREFALNNIRNFMSMKKSYTNSDARRMNDDINLLATQAPINKVPLPNINSLLPVNKNYDDYAPLDTYRKAVPPHDINQPYNWMPPSELSRPDLLAKGYVYSKPTRPQPVTIREWGRTAARIKSKFKETPELSTSATRTVNPMDKVTESFKDKFLLDEDNYGGSASRNKTDFYVDDDISGLPIKRSLRKRHRFLRPYVKAKVPKT